MKNFYILFIAFLISSLGFGQDTDSSVTDPGTQITGTSISSLNVTQGDAVDVFSFVITDSGSGDAFPTKVTKIKLTPAANNTADWATTIEGVTLKNNGSSVIISYNVAETSIDISIASGNLDIASGTSQTITVGMYFKTTGDLVDNSKLAFKIDATTSGFETETAIPATSSEFLSPFAADVTSNDFTVDVIATQLTFLTQPSDVALGAIMTPAVKVGFTDINKNVDIGASGVDIVITANESSLFTSSTDTVITIDGISTFSDLIFTTESTSVTLEAQDFSFILPDAFNSSSFNVVGLPSQTTYTFNGSWLPDVPSGPNNPSSSTDAIVIESGDAILIDDVIIYNVIVNPGASLTVDTDVTLTVVDNLTLDSQSNSYSSFIFNGTPTTNNGGGSTVVAGKLNYKRFVNSNTNGNDLIAPPFENQTWSNFLNTPGNAAALFNNNATNPTTYLFGPFDKGTGTYLNYTSDQSRDLTIGRGFRAAAIDDPEASGSGTTLTFSGNLRVESLDVSLLYSSENSFPDWNLIGNPFPSYIDAELLLNYVIDDKGTPDPSDDDKNIDLLATGSGLYGYDGNANDSNGINGWDVITSANASGKLIAPGQGFLVAATPNLSSFGGGNFIFNPSIRTIGSSDDFIPGRDATVLTFVKIKAATATKSCGTQFYFNDHATLALDHGYDGKVLGAMPNFALYSKTVAGESELPLALQALNPADLTDTTIPLGVKASAGEQITFSITEISLPSTVEVYLEDNANNTFTLLNNGDYTLTPNVNLSGTGRFFLRFTDAALSTTKASLDKLQIYTNYNARTLTITGNLTETTRARIYDLEGRLVNTAQLRASNQTQTIDMSSLSAGVYVVQLENKTQNKTQKVIWR